MAKTAKGKKTSAAPKKDRRKTGGSKVKQLPAPVFVRRKSDAKPPKAAPPPKKTRLEELREKLQSLSTAVVAELSRPRQAKLGRMIERTSRQLEKEEAKQARRDERERKRRDKLQRKEERKVGIRRRPAEKCAGGCDNTGEVEGEPCPVCRPSEAVQAKLLRNGSCVHNHNNGESGACPTCLAKQIVEKSGRSTTKGNRLDVYQVFRDHNGVAYLRVRLKKDREAQFIVNKGFTVELISIDQNHAHDLNLKPVVGASVYEAARRLFTPLNDQVTISVGAKEILAEIITNKEIEAMATKKAVAVPTKTAKFATTQSVPAAPAKKAAKPAPAPEKPSKAPKAEKPAKASKAESNGQRGRTGSFRPEQKIILIQKENPRREGTQAHEWYELYRVKGQTVGGYLEAGGDRGYLKNDFEKRGLIKIV